MSKGLDLDPAIPLVVDLDKTLTLTDTLWEGFARLLFRQPLAALKAGVAVFRGRAAAKRAVTAACQLDPDSLPWRTELVSLLRSEKARGRALHLVSAADQGVVDGVA